ncbi:thioredoxin domain-containing protein [Thiomicrorhabdus sp.]|uniref:thioredoxin domain-containing protein n=1 Tax=Thiomicrorhabdus sp. TaxID=2039724 RepID=UPI0029C97FA2|nr:thioredoxin domain-containing protein [Thiomicrorhabdus sp.]
MPRTLINKIIQDQALTRLTEDSYQEFVDSQAVSMIVFIGDPKRYQEANDLIVVVPELIKAFPGVFSVGVVDEDSERALAQKYGITMWPALVFLKNGKYVDMITRIQDWSEYMNEIPKILDKVPTFAPSIGIGIEVK